MALVLDASLEKPLVLNFADSSSGLVRHMISAGLLQNFRPGQVSCDVGVGSLHLRNMFESSSIPFWTMLAGWAQVLVLIVTAVFVWLYLRETERLRNTGQEQVKASQSQVGAAYEQLTAIREQTAVAQDQLEGQIRPAIVVRLIVGAQGLRLINLGNGPALHIKLSPTDRGSGPKPDLDRFPDEIGFIEVGGSTPTDVRAQGAGITALNGRSLQCQYTSLSGGTHWTVADFDKIDNDRLIATRFYSERSKL